MNRLLICTALAAAIATAGCTSSGAQPTATATPASPTQHYIAALHGLKLRAVQAVSDDELLQLGRTACAYAKHPGEHPYGPVNDMVRNGYADAVTAAAVAKVARVYLC